MPTSLRCPSSLLVAACALFSAVPPSGGGLLEYGQGTPGIAGVPRLWASDAPRQLPGANLRLRLSQGCPNSVVFPFVALSAASTQVAGLEVNLPLASAIGLPLAFTGLGGTTSMPVAIPLLPDLRGLDLFAQAFVLDPASSSPLQLSATPGLRLRVADTPKVFPATIAASNQSTEEVVDLGSGLLLPYGASGEIATLAELSRDGSRLFINRNTVAGSPPMTQSYVRFFDATATVPVELASPPPFLAGGHGINHLQTSPDGTRLYVVSQNQPATCSLDVLEARPAAPGFGLPVAPPVPLPMQAAQHLAFAPDGRTAYVVNNGLIGPVVVAKLDTDPQSPTYHQVLGTVLLTGYPWAFSIVVDPAGRYAYVALNNMGASDLAVLDLQTFTVVDFDPTTAWQDHLSYTGAALGTFVNDLVADPRGGVLYLGEHHGIRRLDVDLGSPGFGQAVFTPVGPAGSQIVFAIGVAAAGDRVYAAEYNSGFLGEYASDTLLLLRSWTLSGRPEGLAVR